MRLHGPDIAWFLAFAGMVLVYFRVVIAPDPGLFHVFAGAVIGATLLLTPSLQPLQRLHLAEWLAAPGRQALMLYVALVLLGMGAMGAMGWIDGPRAPRAVVWGSLGYCTLGVLHARVWTGFFRRGRLEWRLHLASEPRRAPKRS